MTTFLLVAIALAFAFHVAMHFATRRQGGPRVRRLRCTVPVALVLSFWAYCVVPYFVQLLIQGHVELVLGRVPAPPPVVRSVRALLLGLCLALCASWVTTAIKRRQPVVGLARLLAFLAPWLGITLGGFLAGGGTGPTILLYPALAMAVWVNRPHPKTLLGALGVMTALTAAGSVALAVLVPDLGLTTRGTYALDPKALIGGKLLSGPFQHPNTLGIVLALGLPTIMFIQGRFARRLAYAVTIFALAWSASRTSMTAAAVSLVVVSAFNLAPSLGRFLGGFSVLTATATAIALPLSITSLAEYSGRGLIWSGSLQWWQERPWFGYGPGFYASGAQTATNLGRTAFSGHNEFVHVLATGGIASAAGVAVLLLCCSIVGIRQARRGSVALMAFTATLATLFVLEVPTDFQTAAQVGYAAWLPLAALLLGGFTHGRAAADAKEGPKGGLRTPEPPLVTMAGPGEAALAQDARAGR